MFGILAKILIPSLAPTKISSSQRFPLSLFSQIKPERADFWTYHKPTYHTCAFRSRNNCAELRAPIYLVIPFGKNCKWMSTVIIIFSSQQK